MPDTIQQLGFALSDRYRIARELGAGGMATVYLAHDLKHDRDVAIKVLHPELAAALGGDRFLSEIKTTAKLQHPHILPLLDSGDADSLLYYVMPYVEGATIDSCSSSRRRGRASMWCSTGGARRRPSSRRCVARPGCSQRGRAR